MAEPLSAYELTRAEKIRRNNEYLASLGLYEDRDALRKPKPKQVTKPRIEKPQAEGPSRRSSRLDGLPAEEPVLVDDVGDSSPPLKNTARDPYECWWTATKEQPEAAQRPPLTLAQAQALQTPLTAEERDSLDLEAIRLRAVSEGAEEDDAAWVTDFLKYACLANASPPATQTHAC